MTDTTALSIYNREDDASLVIQTIDGAEYQLAPGETMFDYMPPAFQRLPLLKIGQPTSEVLDGAVAGMVGNPRLPAPQFFVQIKAGDTWEYFGPLGESVEIVPIGVVTNPERGYYANQYQEGDTQPPDCHSTNGYKRDARFVGPIPGTTFDQSACAAMVIKNGKPTIKVVCPLADWDIARAQGLKSPACSESYVMGGAIQIDGTWQLVLIPFKGIAASRGKIAVMNLWSMIAQGHNPYDRLMTLRGISKANGNNYAPDARIAPAEWSDSDREGFAIMLDQWGDHLDSRKRMAAMTRDELDAESGTAVESDDNVIDTTAQTINQDTVKQGKTKGRKPMI